MVIPERKPAAAAPKKAAPASKKQEEEPLETAMERKLRLQKLQEAADLDNALHLFGAEHIVKGESESSAQPPLATTVPPPQPDWLQSLAPQTQKDFDAIVETLGKKLKGFEKSKFYLAFVENLAKALLADREVPEIRKIGGVITDLASIKQKERLSAAKKPAPTLAGAKKSSRNDYADFGDFDDDGDGFD